MKRFILGSLLAVAALASATPNVMAADDAATRAQRLLKLKQLREAARLKAAQQAKPPATTPPPATVTAPPATVTPPPATATTPPPATATAPPATAQPTATATAAATAAASSTAAASAATTASAAPSASAAAQALETLRSTRKERRQAEVARLRERWGELVNDERAQAELKLHAERVAYLQRIRGLAEQANDTKTVEAVDKLLTAEERRDANTMNALRTGAAPAPSAGAAK